MKDKSTSLLVHGILNIVSPFISLIVTVVLVYVLTIPDILATDFSGEIPTPLWKMCIAPSPLLICPVSCIWGIIRFAVNRKSESAWVCLSLSIVGFVFYVFILVILYLLTANA